MNKKIVKKHTFKEAFADVLRLSHAELVSHPIDPFIQSVFSTFEKMDFSHSCSSYYSNHKLYSKFLSSYKNLSFDKEKYLTTNKDLCIIDTVNNTPYPYIIVNSERSITVDDELNEVQQWLLAA